jgi:hypothetical protein
MPTVSSTGIVVVPSVAVLVGLEVPVPVAVAVPASSVTPSDALAVDDDDVPVPEIVAVTVAVAVPETDSWRSPPSPHAPTIKQPPAPRNKLRIDIPTSQTSRNPNTDRGPNARCGGPE